MRIPSGKVDCLIFFVAVDSTDYVTRKTGLSAFTVYRSRNGAAATVYTTPTVAELSSSNMPGVYALTVDEDTTIAAGSDSEEYCVHITCATMAPITRTIELYRRDTTTGRTLDVSAGGEAGIDWANVGSPTTALALTNTTIATTQKVDVETIKTNPVVNAGTITFPTTATLASTTNITAGTVTTATNVTTVNGLAANVITATSIAADAITAAKIADGAIDAATFAAGAINAAAIAADAITDAKVASDVTIASVTGAVGSVTGAVGSVTGNVGGNVTGSVGSVAAAGITASSFAADAITAAKIAADVTTELQAGLATASAVSTLQTSVDTIDDFLDTEIAAIKAKTDSLTFTTANRVDSQVYGMEANTMTAAAAAADLTTELQTGLATAAALNTIDDFLDTEVAAIKTVTDRLDTAIELDGAVYRFTTNALELAPTGGSAPTAAEIADAVWDEDATGHQTQGSFGQAIGDPGADTDTIWALVNTNLNATVGSRASQTSVDTIDDFLDTEVAAILADTNELQTDWANGGRLDNILDARSSQTSVDDLPTNAELATALGTADDATLAAIAALTIPTANQNADAFLDRANGVETGLTPRQAMRLSAAADGGKLSGGATTTNTIRNAVADDKDRIVATVDADGNRTAITYDLT